VNHWGQKSGDIGVIARDPEGLPIGAAWLRLGNDEAKLRVADQSVPELATGVLREARGRGIGTEMMQSLIRLAAPRYPQITLSVRAENPARYFYYRLGFVEISRMTNRVGGDSIVMILDLQHANDAGSGAPSRREPHG
jgi:GNAT superfamily N-acetyltransferase